LVVFEDFILTVYIIIDDLYHQFVSPEVVLCQEKVQVSDFLHFCFHSVQILLFIFARRAVSTMAVESIHNCYMG